MPEKEYETYLHLIDTLWRHNKKYYVDHSPEISDYEYDKLYTALLDIEKRHPDWIISSSPSQRVGEELTKGFKSVAHTVPMLSLMNTYSQEELQDFLNRVEKSLKGKQTNYTVELKLDGIACTVIYEEGYIKGAMTRGNGKFGDDILANMKTITSLPLKLHGNNIPKLLEVRGEVFLPLKQFAFLNKQRAEAEEVLWANPRNAAAGSLKLLDPKEVSKRGLKVIFYGIAHDSSQSIDNQNEVYDYLKDFGLPVSPYHKSCKNLQEIWDYAIEIRSMRNKLPFEIDGLVIKVAPFSEQRKLGATVRAPRWAIAYKFAPEQAVSLITAITVQVGRTGTCTPVAELQPVEVAGSVIARASLYNQEEIDRKDIRIGDSVIIEKGGDVIPKVVSVLLDKRPKNALPWKMPQCCPSCGTKLVFSEQEVAVRCPNKDGCFEQRYRSLAYFVSKEAMDIDQLGHKVLEQLMKKGFVSKPRDIFFLTKDKLLLLEGFKEKSANNLINSIEKAKHITLARFIMALGIRYIGSATAEILARHFSSIEKLSHASAAELSDIEGIGNKTASSIVEFFADDTNQEEVAALIDAGLVISLPRLQQDHSFNGKTFVLTGTLQNFSREEAKALIIERGGKVSSSVSKQTDYLLVGENPGSKLANAKKLGISLLSEDKFHSYL